MRLELTRRGDYGVRAMLELARRGGTVVSGTDLARSTQISTHFVTQVMGDLVRAGLVDARIGRAGGYSLKRPAGEITILSIVEAIEGDTRRKTCVLRAAPCSRDGACEVHSIFMAAQDALVSKLAGATLAEALTP